MERRISLADRARHIWAILAALGSAVFSADVPALDNDKVVLGANVSAAYNSNVLGISKEIPSATVDQFLRGRGEGSWIWGYGALARADLPVSNQRFRLDASATWYDYSDFDELNYTGYALRGGWDWRVGSDWWGQLNAGAAQTRQTFSSGVALNLPALVKNYDELADLHYALTPRWEVNGALKASQSRYSAVELQGGNFNMTSEAIGAAYRTPLGNSTGVRLTFEQGQWPERPPVGTALLDNRYTQYTLAMVLDWHLSGRSELSGDIGYTVRTRATVGSSNQVEGLSGRLTYTYLLTGKSQLKASLYQIFGPLDDPTASYAKTTGIDAGYAYQATAKLALLLSGSYQRIDYLGESLVPNVVQRKDLYGTVGLGVRYDFTRTIFFTAGAQYQNRNSNVPFAAYDVYTVYVSANIQF